MYGPLYPVWLKPIPFLFILITDLAVSTFSLSIIKISFFLATTNEFLIPSWISFVASSLAWSNNPSQLFCCLSCSKIPSMVCWTLETSFNTLTFEWPNSISTNLSFLLSYLSEITLEVTSKPYFSKLTFKVSPRYTFSKTSFLNWSVFSKLIKFTLILTEGLSIFSIAYKLATYCLRASCASSSVSNPSSSSGFSLTFILDI